MFFCRAPSPVGPTPPDCWSSCTTHSHYDSSQQVICSSPRSTLHHKQQTQETNTSTTSAGFESAIPAIERPLRPHDYWEYASLIQRCLWVLFSHLKNLGDGHDDFPDDKLKIGYWRRYRPKMCRHHRILSRELIQILHKLHCVGTCLSQYWAKLTEQIWKPSMKNS